jgi:membrane protease YdiL (CAAX protease family)
MSKPSKYNMNVYLRIPIILAVLLTIVFSALGVLPLAKLLGVEPSQLQGSGFEPTPGTLLIVIIFSASQFLIIWLAMHFIHKQPFKCLGFRRPILKPLLVGTVAGFVIEISKYLTKLIFATNASLEWNVPAEAELLKVLIYFLLWLVFLLTLNSIKEELVFRAYTIEQFNDYPNALIWILIGVSLLFAAIHHIIQPFTLTAFLSRFSIALLFSYVYFRWRSIWLVSGFHNGANIVGTMLFGNWKAGGLFDLSYTLDLPHVGVIINTLFPLIALLIIHIAWKREVRFLKLFQ